MECHAALEMLQVVRPDSGDVRELAIGSAQEHLKECDACRAAFERMQVDDRRIGQVMRSVPVPGDLKDRLLQAAGQRQAESIPLTAGASGEETDPVHEGSPATSEPRRMWRRVVAYAVVAAASVVIGVMVWRAVAVPKAVIALSTLRELIPQDISELAAADSSSQWTVPVDWSDRGDRLSLSHVRVWHPQDDSQIAAAAIEFRCQLQQRRVIRGILVSIPSAQVADLPKATLFGRAEVVYSRSSAGRTATVAWQEGDVVYVCAILGGAEDLEALQQRLALPIT